MDIMTVEELNKIKPDSVKTITLFGDTTTKESRRNNTLKKYMHREVISWRILGVEMVVFIRGEL